MLTYSLISYDSSADKTIKVWDLAARAAVSTIADTGEVWAVSWQPSSVATSSSAFVTGGEDGIVRWWKAAGTN
jgi:WD repeat-containing protein 61